MQLTRTHILYNILHVHRTSYYLVHRTMYLYDVRTRTHTHHAHAPRAPHARAHAHAHTRTQHAHAPRSAHASHTAIHSSPTMYLVLCTYLYAITSDLVLTSRTSTLYDVHRTSYKVRCMYIVLCTSYYVICICICTHLALSQYLFMYDVLCAMSIHS